MARYRRALALEYQGEESGAPLIGVKGDALDADRIVALAHTLGVPVVERAALAQALDMIESGDAIPENLYRAVALVLAELERDNAR